MESIKKFGFKVPVVVDKENTIVAGHGRYKAVRRLKGSLDKLLKELRQELEEKEKPEEKERLRNRIANLETINAGEIFAIMARDLTEEEIKEFRIADNRLAELSDWDQELLTMEARQLDGVIGFDYEEMMGIVDEEMQNFKEHSGENIDVTFDKIKNKYKDLVESQYEEYIEVICPHCLTKLNLRKRDILLKIKEDKKKVLVEHSKLHSSEGGET